MQTYFSKMEKNITRAGIVMLVFLTAGLCVSEVRPVDKQEITDKDITLAVETELMLDEGVPAHLIDVETEQGIVTLSGSVDNLLAKNRAVQVAETIKGVRSIINRVAVSPIIRPAADIRKDVKEALLMDPATESYKVDVTVEEGVVTLSGVVRSWAEKKLSATVAMGVRGVRDVINNIEIEYDTMRSDIEIENEIERCLQTDAWVFDNLIEVEVDNGEVTLKGTVGSAAEKRQARNRAWVAGVTAVNVEELEVDWWTRNEMRRKRELTAKTDEEIKRAIQETLLHDPRVHSFNPDIEVENAEVILRGSVSNLKAKRAAEQDARNTVGVWRVLNYLKVRPRQEVSSEKIASNIKGAFARDPIVERHEINVKPINGKVYLYGSVDSEFEKKHAKDVASGVEGVVVIENNIKVDKSWISKSDSEILKDVKSEIFWNPELDSENIEVSVDEGKVTLTGTVESWHNHHLAAEEAYEGGARFVDNELRIKSDS